MSTTFIVIILTTIIPGSPDALPHVHRGRRAASEDDEHRAARKPEGRGKQCVCVCEQGLGFRV